VIVEPRSVVVLHCSRCNDPFLNENDSVALWDDKHAIEDTFHDPDGDTDVDGWLRFNDRYVCQGCQVDDGGQLIEDPEPLPAIEEAVINRTRARYAAAMGAQTADHADPEASRAGAYQAGGDEL
jgi:hypothetical protein